MIKVTISVEKLKAAGACNNGITAFEREFPHGVDTTWTWLHSVWAAKIMPKWVRWGIETQVIPACVARGADLGWADLSGADLGWADLSGADLRGAIGYTAP